jgi:cobalt-precorrin 5A hydrolase
MATAPRNLAVWVLTPNGLSLAQRLRGRWPEAVVHCSRRLAADAPRVETVVFDRLTEHVAQRFRCFDGHIFIMAAGIAVRAVAPLLDHKFRDPAVVVVDDAGRFAVSLLAGHVGGANRLAEAVAGHLGAEPVITTATDANGRPAIDRLALELGLAMENAAAVKGVNMALLEGHPVALWDPGGLVAPRLGAMARPADLAAFANLSEGQAGIYVDDQCVPLPEPVLCLRPPTLAAGIGCNRGTAAAEMAALLEAGLAEVGRSARSLMCIASIDLKADEPGLGDLARQLGVPLHFYSAEALNRVRHVPNPSAMVAEHVGVPSVCEAAALLATDRGTLIVTKRKSANATCAIARRAWPSSASDPATRSTSPAGPSGC